MPKTGQYILALDQGTTSSRSILYNQKFEEIKTASASLPTSYPRNAWVEQNPEDIWKTQSETLKKVTEGIHAEEIKAIGITNQRETVLAWDKKTGEALTPAIVWQCRRSAEICNRLKAEGLEGLIKKKTGLVIDAYFSGSKILWLLENISGLKARVDTGSAVFGTVDSWLLFKLTGEIKTEPSNASRTMLFSIESGSWDDELLEIFQVKKENLPQVVDSFSEFGRTKILGSEIPVTGILGDQQASLFGHGCYEKDTVKCTFGTGAFLLLNTGSELQFSDSGMLSTVAWSNQGELTYAIEGSVFVAGALIQWLRDNLGLISSSAESEELARSVSNAGGVQVVPAFVGLGAPHWDETARGTIFGLTRDSNRAHIVRASLEAVANQVADLLEADEFKSVRSINIDGGMSVNRLFCKLLANTCNLQIKKSQVLETTALGVAKASAYGVGLFSDLSEIAKELSGVSSEFSSEISSKELQIIRQDWQKAVKRSQNWL